MQKWQYITLYVDSSRVVILMNDLQIGKIKLMGAQGPKLHEYLNQLGTDGWEVIGMNSVNSSAGNTMAYLLILKRPML
jgi:ABC-type cobalamin transport system ATPase subunit